MNSLSIMRLIFILQCVVCSFSLQSESVKEQLGKIFRRIDSLEKTGSPTLQNRHITELYRRIDSLEKSVEALTKWTDVDLRGKRKRRALKTVIDEDMKVKVQDLENRERKIIGDMRKEFIQYDKKVVRDIKREELKLEK